MKGIIFVYNIQLNLGFYSILFIVLTLSMGACQNIQKNKLEDNVKNQIVLYEIDSIYYDTDISNSKHFTYDDHGDIITQSQSSNKITFQYNKDNIVKQYQNGNGWLYKIIYQTNTSGKIISSQLLDSSIREISKYHFNYNQDGYLSNVEHLAIGTGKKTIMEYFYLKGNLVKINYQNSDHILSSSYHFTYYFDLYNKYNILYDQLLDDVFSNERLGRNNVNMIKSLTQISPSGDTLSKLEYSYPKVQDKNQLIQIETDVLNQNTNTIIYYFNNIKK